MATSDPNRCRVIHVITRLIVGGAQENTVASVLGLEKKSDLAIELISGLTAGSEGSLENQLTPGSLHVLPNLVRPINPWHDLRAWQKLTAIFRSRQPHVVHTHSGKAGILGRLAARNAQVPVVVHTIHGPSFGPFQGAIANKVFAAAERYVAPFTTHFVSVANAMTQQYLAAGIGQPDQFTRILSGFDLRPFLSASNDLPVRRRLGLGPDEIVVGKIARLVPLKGHDVLLAVAPRLVAAFPRIRFLLVGDGPWRPRLQSQVDALGLSQHFVFAGLVPPADIPAFLGVMDLVVHLSRREGLARALSQALAAGRPVVSLDCDGANEVCLDGQTGFLVPAGNTELLIARILQLAGDPLLRSRLGAQGRELIASQFSVERMVEDLHDLYRRLLADRSVASMPSAA